jgi:cyclopropane fatty-acyl-phospholipid synthase-like methyltransferase
LQLNIFLTNSTFQRVHILDVGYGLGGAARFAANRYNSQITGIDLKQDYIDTGNALCAWVRLDKKITLQQWSALTMPFLMKHFMVDT